MSPRTSSPPPSLYGSSYDDINDYDYPAGTSTTSPGFSNISQTNFYPSQQSDITSSSSNVSRNDVTRDSPKNNDDEKGLFTALLLRPLNIPRRVLSSSVVKCASLMVVYSFCISTICFIFFISYLLTFYDDTRRLFRSSRVWAQLRNGVRERIAMMGDDWEEFLQKYFDQWDGVDVNRNVHLGGNNNSNNNNSNNATNDANSKRDGTSNPEWEEWIKGTVFNFMTFVAGQDAADKFQHSFRSQSPTATAGGDAGRK